MGGTLRAFPVNQVLPTHEEKKRLFGEVNSILEYWYGLAPGVIRCYEDVDHGAIAEIIIGFDAEIEDLTSSALHSVRGRALNRS